MAGAVRLPYPDASPSAERRMGYPARLRAEDRLNRLKAAVQSAGFRTISARSLDDAWAKSYSFDFNAVVIDYELKNDIAASTFRQRLITLNLNEDALPESVAMELTGLFRLGSELVK